MARYIITVPGTYAGTRWEKGAVAELTAAQVTAIGASNLRALNNPVQGGPVTVAYIGGAQATFGTPAGSPTHDLSGEACGVSNSS
jgi:hypothetical protein